MRRLLLACALVTALATAAAVAAAATPGRDLTLTPLLDLRVRQEGLDGVYHFDPDQPDRNWIRVRTRGGLRLDAGAHRLELRLANEHRHVLVPDTEFDWDELILDRGLWSWRLAAATTITLGRQDIIWPGGFLMLEGHPYDGSRSIYQDALRLRAPLGAWSLDAALIHNEKRDPLVIAGGEDRRLTDADESAASLRLERGGWAWSALYKAERDPDEALPDLNTLTLAGRRDAAIGEQGAWHLELALQYQDGRVRSAHTDADPGGTGWAVAGEGSATVPVGGDWNLEAGGFFYSGQDASLRPFRAPWGRWPKWSELYIYTLIGESTPGRVDVAAWENIAAPLVMLRRPLGERLSLRAGGLYLVAPAPSWEARGLLTQVELKADLARGLSGHLLWEMLAPGAYHDGRHGLPPLTDTVHFLRWQLIWTL